MTGQSPSVDTCSARAANSGVQLDIPLLSFDDLATSIRESVERLRSHPWLKVDKIHGLIFDVATGRLHQVT